MSENFSFDAAAAEMKRLPFAKSWQNTFVAHTHNMLNINTGELHKKELNDFIFLPASVALNHYSSNRDFLAFRNDHKNDGMLDFKMLSNETDNENSRLVLLYIAIIIAKLKIYFMIDDKYGIFIEIADLHEKAEKEGGVYKELYRHFAIPKQIAQKNGIVEQWAN